MKCGLMHDITQPEAFSQLAEPAVSCGVQIPRQCDPLGRVSGDDGLQLLLDVVEVGVHLGGTR